MSLHRTLKVCVALLFGIGIFACSHRGDILSAEEVTGGDVKRGQELIYSYNCGACHVIPGVAEASGTVGPPLQGFRNRGYIAGSLINTPENLFRWIREPQQVEPETAMPNLGVTKEQAIDIGAYLYTLR